MHAMTLFLTCLARHDALQGFQGGNSALAASHVAVHLESTVMTKKHILPITSHTSGHLDATRMRTKVNLPGNVTPFTPPLRLALITDLSGLRAIISVCRQGYLHESTSCTSSTAIAIRSASRDMTLRRTFHSVFWNFDRQGSMVLS